MSSRDQPAAERKRIASRKFLARAPRANFERDADCVERSLLVTFLWQDRESYPAAGGTPGMGLGINPHAEPAA